MRSNLFSQVETTPQGCGYVAAKIFITDKLAPERNLSLFSRHLRVRLIQLSINFDYTEGEGKVLLFLADVILSSKFQLI
jgi:hypothetical protein